MYVGKASSVNCTLASPFKAITTGLMWIKTTTFYMWTDICGVFCYGIKFCVFGN